MSIEAMKQALETLYLFATDESPEGYEAISAITALRTAIEQAEKQVEPLSIEAMKQALVALEYCKHLAECQRVWGGTEWSYPFPWKRIFDSTTKSLHTIRTAIEQAEKQVEPFGHFQYDIKLDAWVKSKTNNGIAFYTTPPAAQSQDSGIETVAAKGGLLPKQEPVAWLQIGLAPFHDGDVIARTTKPKEWNPKWWRFEPLYTTPPAAQREWVGLTEPELHEINPTWPAPDKQWNYDDVLAFVRAIEAKLKEKNA